MIEITAEMDASVWQLLVAVGQQIAEEDELVILESMKMEIPVVAPRAGVVVAIAVAEGAAVKRGQLLVTLRPD